MDVGDIIILGITGIFALLVVIGFLFGLGRGLKKATIRLSTVIIFAIIALLITPMITNAVYSSMPIIGGQTIKDWVAPYLNRIDDYTKYTEGVVNISASLLEAIPLAIANLIVFIVIFWLLKAISWVIFALATKNLNKPNEDGTLPKKRRLLGGLIGAVQGLVLFATFAMPLIGTINTIQKTSDQVSAIMVDSEGNSINLFELLNQIVEEQGGESMDDMEDMFVEFGKVLDIKALQKSVPLQVLKYTGIQWLIVDNGFNYLTTVKTETGKVKVAQELPKTITSAATTLKPFMELFSIMSTMQDISEINFEDMKMQEIIETVFDIASSNPYIADMVVELLEEFVNDTEFGDVHVELNIGDSKEFLHNMGQVVGSMVGLFTDLSENGISDIESIVKILEDVSSNIIVLANYMTITLPHDTELFFTQTNGILSEIFDGGNIPLYSALTTLFGI